VRDQQRDGHAQAEGLLDHGLQVGQAIQVRLRHRRAGAQHGGDLFAELGLDRRVVHQLSDTPLDRPQGSLDRCNVQESSFFSVLAP